MNQLITLTLSLILFLSFTSQTLACEEPNKTVLPIDSIYFDTQTHTYMAETVQDEFEGRWQIELKEDTEENVNVLKVLTERYKGKTAAIYYVGNVQQDQEIEIVSSEIIERK